MASKFGVLLMGAFRGLGVHVAGRRGKCFGLVGSVIGQKDGSDPSPRNEKIVQLNICVLVLAPTSFVLSFPAIPDFSLFQ